MHHFEFRWKAEGSLELFGQGWQTEGQSKATISLVHGLGEHSGRYSHVAQCLNQAGYVLIAFDLRGHGKSLGKRGHSKSYGVLMGDIAQFLKETETRYPGRPHFLYGHSLGGNLVLNYALRHCPQLAGVIATGPGLRPGFVPPAWKVALGKAMYNLWPSLSMANGFDREGFSRDPDVLRAYNNDPLVHDRVTAHLGVDILRSGQWAVDHAPEFPLPLLLMHGGADRITSAQATQEFAARAGDCCTLKIWDGFYHEIHNEPEKEQVFAYLLGWLESKMPRS
jgi:alpha-beta hydrolase superfamily lysophospholipase